MPFVQMENISHFLRACQMPPLNLPPHDVFLTVDLYEMKDPAQVLQCLAAFSRRANALEPSKFPRTVGPQSKRGVVSPNATGSSSPGSFTTRAGRASSNASDANAPGSGWAGSPSKSGSLNAPAWNIHQYGYMGGASQGNQGIAFGARRQITSPSPAVPSFAEKEKRRREEEEKARQQEVERKEAELAREREIEEQEAQARAEEERKWEEETARMREKERQEMEEEKKRWDAEQRQWEEDEQRRLTEEKEAEARFEEERQNRRSTNDTRLNGQFLSQYQAGLDNTSSPGAASVEETPESRRIKELERELELAKERERQYETERQGIQGQKTGEERPSTTNHPGRVPVPPKPSYDLSSLEQERRMLRGEWIKNQDMPAAPEEPEQTDEHAPPPPPRPLPEPVKSSAPEPPARDLPPAPRPLPNPTAYNPYNPNRTDRFLASNPAPSAPAPVTHRPQDYSTTSEVDAENSRRIASQQKTRAGGWASKSLLEREMERERERQREWEEAQKRTQEAAGRGVQDPSAGTGPGQSWDVHQYGYMGGDNQNRGGHGLGLGGARRQIIGPRPPP